MQPCPRPAFRRWAFLLCRTLVEQSNRAPHVSGYFKMLAVCAQLADRYGYFRGLGQAKDGACLRINSVSGDVCRHTISCDAVLFSSQWFAAWICFSLRDFPAFCKKNIFKNIFLKNDF